MGFLDYFKVSTSRIAPQAELVINIFERGLIESLQPEQVLSELKSLGLTYRRQNMLDDVAKYATITRVKHRDPLKMDKVNYYFENVVEPFRKGEDLSRKDAWKAIHDWENQEKLTDERAWEVRDYASKYNYADTPNLTEETGEEWRKGSPWYRKPKSEQA